MNKKDLKKLALLGLASGLVLAQNVQAATNANNAKDITAEFNAGLLGGKEYTEKDLLNELDDNGKKMYNSLSPEGKKLAVDTASATCSGQNKCKGLNACKNDKHACMGLGECKGQGKCAITDKNKAVKLVYNKMAGRRAAVGAQ